ncbi:MAG: CYTH domain-containing protein [Bacteroidetes bacterium]|nr:CYTH domain-containing protein [Bacteroidota bacterium]
MPKEIERKFLVRKDLWYAVQKPEGADFIQGYLVSGANLTIRVRVSSSNAWLTIKGPFQNISRDEYEYPIPAQDAMEILSGYAGNKIEKTRYRIRIEGHIWEVDEFFGDNEGLIIAEIELKSEDEGFRHPPWLGEEVTANHRYNNAHLAEHPFGSWKH